MYGARATSFDPSPVRQSLVATGCPSKSTVLVCHDSQALTKMGHGMNELQRIAGVNGADPLLSLLAQ